MATTTIRNGVNVNQLVATVQAIQQNPALAQFTFRARSEWKGGGRSEATIGAYVQAGAEQARGATFTIAGDEPPVLLGANTAPNAVETVLAALAGCYAVGFAYNAAARGIDIDELRFELEGELDLHGFLGLSDEARPGFSQLTCIAAVKSTADPQALDELCEYVQRTSPVLDILRRPTPVTTRLAVI
jgi:uncharacterized OsmC-like protein